MDTGTTKACPFCAETIHAAAIACRYCGRDLPAAPPALPSRVPHPGDGKPSCSVCGGYLRSDATYCKHCHVVFGAAPSVTVVAPAMAALPSAPEAKHRSPALIIGIAIALVVLVCAGFAVRGSGRPSASSGATTSQIVTINASDGAGGMIDPINVWDNYQTRGAVVARLHHGDTVTMLSRSGNGVQIQTAAGVRGWLTYSFIRELK